MKLTTDNVVDALARLLDAQFGARCKTGKTFPWLAAPKVPANSPLGRIARELDLRSWGKAVADAYFGAPLNLLFAFDGTQHFTPWRAKTLAMYPPEAPLNFDLAFQLAHCRKRVGPSASLGAKRLALRDAMLDLLPAAHGLNPTLRIAEPELGSCRSKQEIVERLAALLEKRLSLHAGTTFLQMLEHPSGKPWVPRVFGFGK